MQGRSVSRQALVRAQCGVSLIEVLIAVLIFAVGLIGLAGLLLAATRSNQIAFSRTQLTFLANSMVDRMRANPVGMWQGSYDNTHYPITGKPPACDATSACSPADVAKRDQIVWSTMLSIFLPGLGQSSLTCDKSGAGYDATAQVGKRPPYAGTCTMKVAWAERGYGNTDDKTGPGNLQSFTWVFQP
jgi:type IV pilus assembly protein PilV